MMQCIAIDDELLALELIEKYCAQIPFLQLERTFYKTSEATKYLNKFPVDLLFLDIVRDADTGEELIGATIVIREKITTGASTNAYGFYSITLPPGNYTVVSQYVGYESQEVTVVLDRNVKMDFKLSGKASQPAEVVVSSEREDEKIRSTTMGVEKIDLEEIAKIPVILGERDIIKTLQLLPGVKSSTERSSGFFVRGGGADQNLILLDEAPVYNASHLMGFFSVFNPDALKDVTLYKGNMPAEYGGRLSSVLDIKMKEGNNQEFDVYWFICIVLILLCTNTLLRYPAIGSLRQCLLIRFQT